MPLDPESIRLIEERRRAAGLDRVIAPVRAMTRLGAPAKTQAFDVLTGMTTNTQARHVLGIVSKWLRQGYEAAQTFPFLGGEAKKNAIDLLDRTNAYAMKIYAKIPDDTNAVSPQTRKEVALAVKQSASNLKLVSNEAQNLNQGLLTDLVDYLQHAAKESGFGNIPRWVIWAGLGIVGLVGLTIVAKLVHTVMLGRAELRDAEEDAMRLAGAAQRERQARKVATIS